MNKWDLRFMNLAYHVAEWSKDYSTRVGCVLVDDNNRVIGMGYNGFPRGVADSDDRLSHRPTKYGMVIHAEVNAVLNAVGSVHGAVAYVTHKPCSNCTGVLIQAGISSVVYPKPSGGIAERFEESFRLGSIMFKEAGVSVTEI